jgi:predicted glycosyltransferase
VVALEDSFRSDPVVQPGSFTPHQASVLWDAVWEQLHSKLTYTGYMAPNGTVKPVDSDYHDNVIVATGMDWHPSNDTLVRAVMQAIPHTGDALKAKTWRLLANHSRIETMPAEEGGDAARATLAWMQDQAEQLRQKGIRVEVQDAIRELHNTMAVCGLSVQHAGGAQLLEALGLGIPFLPFPLGMDGPHYEQKTRLDLLEQQGLCVSGQRRWLEDARDGNLSATQFLADRMSEAHQRGRSECWLDMNGAQTTADAVHGLLARAKARVTGSASLAEIPASLSHQMAA